MMCGTFVICAVTSGELARWAVDVRGRSLLCRGRLGAGARDDGGAVGVGDGADDGQAESVSFPVADPLDAELPERLEEVVDRVRGMRVPVLPTVMTVPVLVRAVVMSAWPPGRLCRMALSMRLAIRLSARFGWAAVPGSVLAAMPGAARGPAREGR